MITQNCITPNITRFCTKLLIYLFCALLAFPAFGSGTTEKEEERICLEGNGRTIDPPEIGNEIKRPFTVIDSFGREVAVPGEVERISCIYAFSAHMVTMLGRGEDIISVVYGSKRDRLLNEINPQIKDAAVPSDDGVINIEELIKIEPDIILLKGETALMESEIAKLERFKLPFVVIHYDTIEEQMYAIELIGKVIDREEEAKKFNAWFQGQIDFVSERLKDLPEDERVRVYHSVNEAARTDAQGTLPAEWTALAGADNVSVGEPLRLYDNKYFASLEQIYIWNPDLIIANQEGVNEYMLTNEKWAGLKAVQEGKVYQIPIGISRWGHPGGMETPLAMIWTARLLYPALFADVNIEEVMRDFYYDFFDFTLTPEMIARILSGKGMRLPKGEIREAESN